jgi:hypothetical protein
VNSQLVSTSIFFGASSDSSLGYRDSAHIIASRMRVFSDNRTTAVSVPLAVGRWPVMPVMPVMPYSPMSISEAGDHGNDVIILLW